jgi:hypothetical protein
MDHSTSNSKDYRLVEDVPESISTDIITDLKSGIYNLFISLYNHLIVDYGPEQAVVMSTDFIDDISRTFKRALDKDQQS